MEASDLHYASISVGVALASDRSLGAGCPSPAGLVFIFPVLIRPLSKIMTTARHVVKADKNINHGANIIKTCAWISSIFDD